MKKANITLIGKSSSNIQSLCGPINTVFLSFPGAAPECHRLDQGHNSLENNFTNKKAGIMSEDNKPECTYYQERKIQNLSVMIKVDDVPLCTEYIPLEVCSHIINGSHSLCCAFSDQGDFLYLNFPGVQKKINLGEKVTFEFKERK